MKSEMTIHAIRTPKCKPTKKMVSVSNIAEWRTHTLILCAKQNSTDCARNIVERERVAVFVDVRENFDGHEAYRDVG